MGMQYGPIGSRLRQAFSSRMPIGGQDYEGDEEMPIGARPYSDGSDIDEETFNPGQVGPGLRPPGQGPIARALMVHSPAEAKSLRGYAMPQLDAPGLPSAKDPAHMQDTSPLHTAQHQSITRALNQKRWMAQQKLLQHRQQLSNIIAAGKAGQDVDKAKAQLATVEALLQQLGPMPQPGQ